MSAVAATAGIPSARRMRALSVVVVAHDAGMELVGCLGSLRDRAGRAPEIVLVLNGTVAPEVGNAARFIASRVIVPDDNIGFAAACNLGARHATGDVLVFLNPDTLASPAAVRRLARTLEDPSIGIATARLRLLREPELLNSSGNVLHITGLGWVGGYRERAEDAPDAREVAFPSGAAMAIRADVFRDLGGFREELFLYHEDVDLGWRAHLRGLRVVMTPTADVYHDYSFDRNPRKHYFLERNRLSFLVCDFSARMLLLLAPVLVAAELAMLVLAWREGWVRQKAAGWMWCLRNLPALIRRRRETQRDRRVSDRDLAGLLTAVIDPRVLKVPAAIRFVNPLLVGYWALVKRAL